MNGHDTENIALYEEFEQFIRERGYFFELGHAWSMGFYPLPARVVNPDLHIYDPDRP
jgi:hypothetical protein